MVIAFVANDDLRTTEGNALVAGIGRDGAISGLATTQRAAGANMSVDVALGVWYINNVRNSTSGVTNVVIAASDPTNDRYDIILGTNANTIVAVAGVAGANPFPPAIPANRTLIAIVRVPAAAVSIVNANIRDARINLGLVAPDQINELLARQILIGIYPRAV